jgi:DNA repair protein RecO (recombination protein O)
VSWRARLEEHLGTFQLELLEARAAALIADRLRLYASQLVCEHLHLLPERDPHDRLLAMAERIMEQESTPAALGAAVARYELVLLEELGFGLDLTSCAATGATRDLTHVSPKSGRAVSRAAAEPYLSRLLRLPPFLIGNTEPQPGDIADAFKLTGYFLDAHVWMPRQLDQPAIRDTFVGLVS